MHVRIYVFAYTYIFLNIPFEFIECYLYRSHFDMKQNVNFKGIVRLCVTIHVSMLTWVVVYTSAVLDRPWGVGRRRVRSSEAAPLYSAFKAGMGYRRHCFRQNSPQNSFCKLRKVLKGYRDGSII